MANLYGLGRGARAAGVARSTVYDWQRRASERVCKHPRNDPATRPKQTGFAGSASNRSTDPAYPLPSR